MNYTNITYPDVNNGLGCRVTLWLNGCTHACVGCHNKSLWDFNNGKNFSNQTQEELFKLISLPYIKGLTLSGGDPLDNYDGVIDLLKNFKTKFGNTKDVWLYTGYTLDEIRNSSKIEVLNYIDFLVDGEFNLKLKDLSLLFRGSSNQTIWENKNGEWLKSNMN